MANDCSFQRQLARQVASYAYGDLNPMAKSEIGGKLDESSSFMVNVKEIIKRSKQMANSAGGSGTMKALVLYAWKEKITFSSAPKLLVHVKALIPERNLNPYPSALPVDNDPKDKCADWSTINMHITFVAENSNLPLPKPTDIIKVDFGNRDQFRDPVYLSVVSSALLACEGELAHKNKLPTKDCMDALKRNMEKVSEYKTQINRSPSQPLPSAAPKKSPPLNPFLVPKIGAYLPPFFRKYRKDGNPKKTGFWAPDWIERVVDAGINYVSFKLHDHNAARDGTMIGNDYTKKLTGRTVKEEINHVLKVARAKNPYFEVHGWGASGVQRHGNNFAYTGRPRDEQEAEQLAIREAQAVGKKMNFLGLKDYHWNAQFDAFQGYPGHIGFSANPLPGKRSNPKNLAMNDITAATFANELRKQVPSVRIWFNGFIECISQNVLMEFFDVVEPQSWPVGAASFRKKLDGKHLGAPDGIQILPVSMQTSWTIPDGGYGGTYDDVDGAEAWESLRDKIIQYKARIYGVHIFALSALLYQGYNGWPSLPVQIRQLREGYL